MNICLTTECNNHCFYCFQKEMHQKIEQFSLSNLKKVIQWAKQDLDDWGEGITLLGGEPTLYPYLNEAIQLIYQEFNYYFPISIITNLLCTDKEIEILNNYENLTFLINSTYDENKKTLFFNNLKKLNKKNVSLSITLTINKNLNQKYIENFNNILLTFPEISKIRIGLQEPSVDDKWTDIYNYEQEIDMILNLPAIKNIKKIGFDCPINFCNISENYYLKLIENPKIINLKRQCYSPPLDILPSLSAKYCYSSNNNFFIDNIFEYKSQKKLKNILITKGKDNYLVKNKKCLNCIFYKKRKCFPCHCIDSALLKGEKNE